MGRTVQSLIQLRHTLCALCVRHNHVVVRHRLRQLTLQKLLPLRKNLLDVRSHGPAVGRRGFRGRGADAGQGQAEAGAAERGLLCGLLRALA